MSDLVLAGCSIACNAWLSSGQYNTFSDCLAANYTGAFPADVWLYRLEAGVETAWHFNHRSQAWTAYRSDLPPEVNTMTPAELAQLLALSPPESLPPEDWWVQIECVPARLGGIGGLMAIGGLATVGLMMATQPKR